MGFGDGQSHEPDFRGQSQSVERRSLHRSAAGAGSVVLQSQDRRGEARHRGCRAHYVEAFWLAVARPSRWKGVDRDRAGRGARFVLTIVSGLPRSGTSLMMQMLAAGGMTLLTDHERRPDVDNPRGYCEWEPIKLLPKEPHRIDEAEGKAVKVISQLLLSLPQGRSYKLIFMERPLPEVLASQDEMLKRRGSIQAVDAALLTSAFRDHLRGVAAWL